MGMPLFRLGRVVATIGAVDALNEALQSPFDLLLIRVLFAFGTSCYTSGFDLCSFIVIISLYTDMMI